LPPLTTPPSADGSVRPSVPRVFINLDKLIGWDNPIGAVMVHPRLPWSELLAVNVNVGQFADSVKLKQ
jgi:hypothetical protein